MIHYNICSFRFLGYNSGSVYHVIWNAGEAFSDSQGVLRLRGCHPDRDASLAECSSKEVIPVAGVQCGDIQYGRCQSDAEDQHIPHDVIQC